MPSLRGKNKIHGIPEIPRLHDVCNPRSYLAPARAHPINPPIITYTSSLHRARQFNKPRGAKSGMEIYS